MPNKLILYHNILDGVWNPPIRKLLVVKAKTHAHCQLWDIKNWDLMMEEANGEWIATLSIIQ